MKPTLDGLVLSIICPMFCLFIRCFLFNFEVRLSYESLRHIYLTMGFWSKFLVYRLRVPKDNLSINFNLDYAPHQHKVECALVGLSKAFGHFIHAIPVSGKSSQFNGIDFWGILLQVDYFILVFEGQTTIYKNQKTNVSRCEMWKPTTTCEIRSTLFNESHKLEGIDRCISQVGGNCFIWLIGGK